MSLLVLRRLSTVRKHVIARPGFRSFSSPAPSADATAYLNSGVTILPHYSKVEKGGEDGAELRQSLIVIADGVGGWSLSGVDPGIYARSLCRHVAEFHEKGDRHYKIDPKQLLVRAVEETRMEGSSTCVLAMLDPEKREYLHTANIGDSGYMLLRKNGLDLLKVFRSEELQHSFNFPFQVGTGGDDPATATVEVHEVKNNDIIVMGTDGLWDNMYE